MTQGVRGTKKDRSQYWRDYYLAHKERKKIQAREAMRRKRAGLPPRVRRVKPSVFKSEEDRRYQRKVAKNLHVPMKVARAMIAGAHP